jgi:hypothetical protein
MVKPVAATLKLILLLPDQTMLYIRVSFISIFLLSFAALRGVILKKFVL